MPITLKDIAGGFVGGTVELSGLRAAAQAEMTDRGTADQILMLLTKYENSEWTVEELREQVQAVL